MTPINQPEHPMPLSPALDLSRSVSVKKTGPINIFFHEEGTEKDTGSVSKPCS